MRPNVRAIVKHTTTPGIGGLIEWSHVRSIRLPVRDGRNPRMKRAGGYVAGWAAPRVRSPGGVPTAVRTKTSMAFDARVSGVLTAALDRG